MVYSSVAILNFLFFTYVLFNTEKFLVLNAYGLPEYFTHMTKDATIQVTINEQNLRTVALLFLAIDVLVLI